MAGGVGLPTVSLTSSTTTETTSTSLDFGELYVLSLMVYATHILIE
jgi:hypothetical protein